MSRHISDLSWRVGALTACSQNRSESVGSAPDANKAVMLSSRSTPSLKANTLTYGSYYLSSTSDYLANSTNNILDIPSSDGSESNVISHSIFRRSTVERRKYKKKRPSSPSHMHQPSGTQNAFDGKKGTILQALNEAIFSTDSPPRPKQMQYKRRYPEITITRVETMDQTSLEFLYPLPSYLIVNHRPNTSNVAGDVMACNSHYERNINENSSVDGEIIEKDNNTPTTYNDDISTDQKEDENESPENSSLLNCNSCDNTFKISKLEEGVCLKENRFTSTTFFF